jgi:hypothetical protein
VERPEQALHKDVAKALRERAKPGCVWFHVPNQGRRGGRRGFIDGAILKSLGVRAGVSDFIMLHNREFFALELKAANGRPSEEQMEFMDDVNNAGGFAACAVGYDMAVAMLETWGLLRGKTQ